MNSEAGGANRIVVVFVSLCMLTGVAGRGQTAVVGAGPVRELWRSDLVNVPYSVEYHAKAAVLDEADNVFVGGIVTLWRAGRQDLPFVAKFDKAGMQEWEYWTQRDSPELTMVDGLASDGRGGVYAALRVATGGVQLVWLDYRGVGTDLERLTNCANTMEYEGNGNSVGLAADGQGGFYCAGLYAPGVTNALWDFALAHYDAGGAMLWRTNLFKGGFAETGLDRALVVTTNSLYFCSQGMSGAQLAKVRMNGAVDWVRGGRPNPTWTSLTALGDETVCVAGDYNYEVWSAGGERLASHGAEGYSIVARQTPEAAGFLVLDAWNARLGCLDRRGVIEGLGQLPNLGPEGFAAAQMINVGAQEWILALNYSEGNSSYTNNLHLFGISQKGELKWRQLLPGLDYAYDPQQARVVNHWLLKAADGTLRLVANLAERTLNGGRVAVAAFSITNQYAAPTLTSYPPLITEAGPEGATLQVQAEGSGQLAYEWHFAGQGPCGTNATLTNVPAGVYCVRVTDENGEMFSPAFSVVATNEAYEYVRGSASDGPALTVMPGVAVQFQVESSTNLSDWVLDPTVYSWMRERPVGMIAPEGPSPGCRFFRARVLPGL